MSFGNHKLPNNDLGKNFEKSYDIGPCNLEFGKSDPGVTNWRKITKLTLEIHNLARIVLGRSLEDWQFRLLEKSEITLSILGPLILNYYYLN